jgi:hypothetical protein
MRADPIRLAQNATDNPELELLLNPAAAFKHPSDVVSDPDLTRNEKRAILSSWAWACAVESSPASARGAAVTFDDVVDALRGLDKEKSGRPHWKRRLYVGRSGFEGPTGAALC